MRLPFARRAEPTVAAPLAHGLDFHNHLLPAVDDGMPDLATSREAIVGLRALGFAGAVVTPHLYAGVFDNNAADLRARFRHYTSALAAAGEDFPLYLAGEYFTDEHFLALIEAEDLLYIPLGGARCVLMEFPFMQETPYAGPALAALRAHGYRPVIAHVERYRFVAQAPELWLERFAQAGAILQGDIGSLAGQYGPSAQRLAESLLDQKLISIWGTDVHHPAQLPRHIEPAMAKLAGLGRLNPILDELLPELAA
jgi:tyrosine-protein phosphatase YwqE